MRNRCIELCLLEQPAAEGGNLGQLQPADDLMMCLASEGVPGSHLPEAMVQAHLQVVESAASMHE